MACSLPMILTAGCNMKYLSNEKYYLMCEPYPQDLARALDLYISDTQAMKTLGEKAKKVLEDNLHWEQIVKVMEENYKRIIKK